MRITRKLEQHGIQNLYSPGFRGLSKLIGDVDVVHLHSLWKSRSSFADLSGIAIIAKQYPTVMTLRDGWTMTGHCACPIGCDRWKTGCGHCPDLERAPSIEKDFTAINWRRKQRVFRKSDLQVTTVSSWLKQQVEASPVLAGKSVHVVHNSVDSAGFSPGETAAARRVLGIPENAFVVLLAGQSIEGIHQGIAQHGIRALNSLHDQSILTMLVGRSAPEVAATLSTPSIVIPFRHTPEEMAECYRAADLTIVPSEYETFGRVAAESLFCGTPVLAFATGGLTDIVQEGVSGKLVPTGDVDALKTAIAEFRANPARLAGMRSSCSVVARQRFSPAKITAEYLRVYRVAMESRHRTAS